MDLWGIAAWLVSMSVAVPAGPPCTELVRLDDHRALAFARADATMLREVYVSEQAAEADLQILQTWQDSGGQMRGGHIHLLACEVVAQQDRRIELAVVDRLGPTWLVDAAGARRLPDDHADARRVVLERVEGNWRIAEVTAQ